MALRRSICYRPDFLGDRPKMDPLSEVISFLEPRRYFVGGFEAGGDWSVRFGAYDGIKCYAVTSGACCLAACRSGSRAIRTCPPMIGSAIFAAPATACWSG